jgi:hypothetical protein
VVLRTKKKEVSAMEVRVVPTKVHSAIDYVTAPALAAAPELLRLDGAGASALAPRAAGVAAAVYGPLTDYELGVRRIIPMRVHVALDALAGGALAIAPWLFGSARNGLRHWLPHAIIGGSELGLALTTRTKPKPPRLRRMASTIAGIPPAVAKLPPGRRAAALAVPAVAAGALVYAGRRYVFRAAAVGAEAVEEVADSVEDATDAIEDVGDSIEDAADDLKKAAKAKAAEKSES